MIDGFMTVGELAAYLGIYEGIVLWRVKLGTLPAGTTVMGRTVFPMQEISAWVRGLSPALSGQQLD